MINTFKLVINISLMTLVLFLGGNYSAVSAQENSSDIPRVIAQVPSNIKELPKTGLPLVGLGAVLLLPAGLLFKRLMRKNNTGEESANKTWMGRNLRG